MNSTKLFFKTFIILFVVFAGLNQASAQCNSGATAGTVNSNNSNICVGATETFWSTGWGGGTWSSSNPSIVQITTAPNGNANVKGLATGTVDIIYTLTQPNCSVVKTASKTINIYNSIGTIGEITGTNPQCANATNQTFTVPAVTNAANYVWNVPGGWSITSGSGTNTINVTVGNTSQSGNITVYATNSCGSTTTKYYYVNINPTLNSTPNVTGATNIQCSYAQLNWNQVNNATGYYLDIATDSGFTNFVSGYNAYNVTYNNGSSPASNLPPGTLYYRVRAYNSCTTTGYSNVSSFSTTAPLGGSVSPAQTICSGGTPSSLTLSGYTGSIVRWEKSTDAAFTSPIQINVTTATLTGATIGTLTANTYFRAVVTASNCNSNSNSALITVGSSGAVSSAQTICTGNTPASLTLSGYTGSIVRWEKSTDAAFTSPTTINVTTATLSSTTIGTLTSNTYFRAIVNPGSPCGTAVASSSVLITISPNNTISLTSGAGSNSRTTCINSAITNITYSTTGATGATFSNLPAGVSGSWASNAVTISGSPTASGTFNYTVTLTGGCGTITATGTITVNPNNTITLTSASGTNVQTRCINNAITTITYSTTGATGATFSGLPSGVTGNWASNVVTISGSPTTTTGSPFNYTVTLTGGCGTITATGTITVNPNNTITLTSASGTNVQTRCINNAITNITYSTTGATGATFSGLPAGVTGNWASNAVTISGTPTTTTGSPFNYTVTLSGGCGTTTATGTITVNAVTAITTQPTAPTAVCSGSGTQTISVSAVGASLVYVWKKDGTAVTNGGAISGQGTNTLTLTNPTTNNVGSYTVEITGSCGSTVTSNAVSVTVITTDRGRTHGGRHICYGTQPNKLTLANADDPNQGAAYSYPEKVVRWEYSDDNNVTWIPIAGTANLIEYQPTELLYAKRAYRAVAQTSGCPQGFAAIETSFDIDPLPTVTFTSQAGTTSCTGVNVTYTTQTGQSNYAWIVSGSAGTDYTITGGGIGTTSSTVTLRWLTTGTKTVTVNYRNSNGCTSASPVSSSTTVETAYAAPVLGTIVRPTCSVPTGSVTLSGLPNSGTLLFNGPNSTNGSRTISGTGTMTVSGLVPGDYSFAIQSNCGNTYSSTITIQSANKWNGTAWSNGVDPTIDDIIEFNGNYNLNKDINGCSCTIKNGANVTIKAGKTLTIKNALDVNTGGSLILENNASLVQTTNAVNTGNIIYKRDTQPIRRMDFTYWSAPVRSTPAFTLHDLSPTTLSDKYYSYNASGSAWVINYNGTLEMLPGNGYIVRAPQEFDITNASIYSTTFTGVPNNGDIVVTPVATKWNLIGNPYPSAIDADILINNAGTGALYFWTHNSPPSGTVAGDAKYNYTTNDYAVYTLTGSTGTASGAATMLGKIAAGQAFFFKASTGNNIVFTNSMRVAGNNSQFFKTTETNIEKNRLWLNFSNEQGAYKQALIGYIEGATNSFDQNYDAATLNGNTYVDFYSINDAKKLTVQGRAVPFEDTDVIALGYKTAVAGEFTISIDHTDGLLNDQKIYLEDKTTNTVFDLKAGDYKFKTEIGTFTDRFQLKYTNKTLGTGDFENVKDGLLVSVKDKVIKVTASKENIKEVNVYDISGRLLYSKNKIGTTELLISNLQSANQVLLVKVALDNDSTTTRKVIFN